MLLVDLHEPDDIFLLLKQTIPQVEKSDLNGEGKYLADYLWTNRDSEFEQLERKHWTEIIPNIDKTEHQLDTQRFKAKLHYLLVEDLFLPTSTGGTSYTNLSERTRKGGGTYLGSKRGWKVRRQPQIYHRVMSWLYKLTKSGIEVWQSPNKVATATIISVLYYRSQRSEEENWAFQDYYQNKAPKAIRDPHVASLMGITNARIGPAKGKALVDAFGTLQGAVSASELNLVQVIGSASTKTFLKAVGR